MEIRVKKIEEETRRTRVRGTVACTTFLRDNRTKSRRGSTIFFPFPRNQRKKKESREEKASIGSNWETRDGLELLTVNIVHADVKILPEGGKAVVALAGASVVRRDEARGRRATRVRAGRSAAEHRASLRAGTCRIIFLILISRKEKGINFTPVNYER